MKHLGRVLFFIVGPLLMLGLTSVGHAAIEFNFESPVDGQVMSGISFVSGWAFSTNNSPDDPVTVRLQIDGGAASLIPCCANRADVAAVFPNSPQALNSGFGQLRNFNLLPEGAHELTIQIEDATGDMLSVTRSIRTVKPGGFAFLEILDLLFADLRLNNDRDEIILDNVVAEEQGTGETERIDIRLAWQENLQALGIILSENRDVEEEASSLSSRQPAAQGASVRTALSKNLLSQAARVQFPSIIRVDPTTGDRTVLSDANTDVPDDPDTPDVEEAGPNWVVPQGIAVEDDGRLAVTDSGRISVLRVDPTTGQREVFSGSNPLGGRVFVRPNGVAAYPASAGIEDGDLVVADSGIPGVVNIEQNGRRTVISDTSIQNPFDFIDPFGVAINSEGQIFVTDVGLKAVVMVDRNTAVRVILSDKDTGSGVDFDLPVDIALADNDIFVVDLGLKAVIQVNPTNGNRTIVSDAMTGDGPSFSQPRALAIENDGQLVVVDEGLRVILRVNPTTGTRTLVSGDMRGMGDEFRVPYGIDVDADGDLIVVDTAPLSTAFENPRGASASGFGMVTGWAFANSSGANITNRELKIDPGTPEEISFDLLCCFERADVSNVFPDRPQSLLSGFGTPINFNLLSSGSHTFEVTIQESSGASRTESTTIDTVKLGGFEFIDDFDMSDADVFLITQQLGMDNLKVRDGATGEVREVDATFQWQQSCQCFVAASQCGNGSLESNEECDGAALAGQNCATLGFSGGDLACTETCSFDFSSCEGGTPVLVTNSGDDTVSVISPATHEEEAIIPVGENPRSIVLNQDRTRAYVTNALSNSISIIDIASNQVTATIENVGDIPSGLAFVPDGSKLYVVTGGSNSVSVIDPAAMRVVSTIPVGAEPAEIAINEAGTRAYVTNFGGNTVSVINLDTDTVIATIPVDREPNGIAVRPGDAQVYVVNFRENTVSIIDTSTNQVTRTLTRESDEGGIGLLPQKVIFSADGQRAFISNSLDFTVSILDAETGDSLEDLFVGVEAFNTVLNQPNGMAITPNTLRLYVTLFGRNGQGRFIGVFSTQTNRIQAFTEVGDGPIGIVGGP